MRDRPQIARATAAALRRSAESGIERPAVIGFDGFVDTILRVVDQRQSLERYQTVPTITRFAEKIGAAAGHSANFELVTRVQKLGGNGPIMANALAALGVTVTYIGSLGQPEIHPAFAELAARARCLSIGEPGLTDAIEFEDGKLMLGKHEALAEVNWDNLCERTGRDQLMQVFNQAQLIGMVNWSMLTELTDIWQHLLDEVLPNLAEEAPGHDATEARSSRTQRVFIDLADPAKRSRSDLRHALDQCAQMQRLLPVTLGLNLSEARQAAAALKLADAASDDAQMLAAALLKELALDTIVVHPRQSAAAAQANADGAAYTVSFAGPFMAQPHISTGAGDHFNAGFAFAQLAGLELEACLCAGVATSGYYVRHAASPSLHELAAFCDELPPPDA